MRRVRVGVNEAHGDRFELLRGNAGDRLLQRLPVEWADYRAAVVEPFRHLETPAASHQWRRTLLIHIVKAHQPQPADLEQVSEALGRNQPGSRAAPFDDSVGRDGRAVDQLFHAVPGDARLLEQGADTGEDGLGVVTAGRQDLAAGDTPVLGDEDEIGKGAADIDAEATRGSSGHMFTRMSPRLLRGGYARRHIGGRARTGSSNDQSPTSNTWPLR